jgi:hypothetical protein
MTCPAIANSAARVPDLLAALTAYGLSAAATSGSAEHAGAGATDRARVLRESPSQGNSMKYVERFFDWLNAGIAEGERARREAYLAQSTDHCDLEYRMRALEREPSPTQGWF